MTAIPADLATRIATARGFILDMDGTLALGDRSSAGHVALPGAIDLLATLRRRGIPFRIYTNGTAKHPAIYASSLRNAGLDVADDEMMTPSTAAAAWLSARNVGRVRVLGTPGTAAPLREAGIEVIDPATKADGVEYVFTGWHTDFAFADLDAAVRDVWAGASLVTASQVPVFAAAGGRAIGTSYAINAMITALTGARPTVLGKPSRESFFVALAGMGLPKRAARDVVVVGDDPALEMRMANRVGALSVGVATGLHSLESLAELPDASRPALALAKAGDLLAALT